MAEFPTPRQDEFRQFSARLAADPHAPPLVGNRHFWCSDYMVHHRPNWMASVKMFSTRTINAELVNSEGPRSQHLSDGANFLYLTGDEYLDIFPVWDWTKVPGTTAEQNTLEIAGETKSIGIKSKCSFVGGVSDGTFGLAAMQLARGKLSARKCWVFLDDCYVCLGAGISCDTDNPVATCINQCLLDGKVSKRLGWIHHANVGYVFLDQSAVRSTAGPQEGAWADIGTGSKDVVRKDVFNLWIDHGRHPKEATYAYCVFPGVAANQMQGLASSPGVQILANTSDAQAVRSEKLDLTALAFWKAGRVGAIEVDQPCLLLVRKQTGKTTISVSNPENQPLTVNVQIEGRETTFKLPEGPKAGSSVTIEFNGGH
jgi:chondroitin AC lyase